MNNLNLEWYPGHMKKAKELLISNLKLIDVIIQVIDSRIPLSSINPDIMDIIKNKPFLIALNKTDLAEDYWTDKWLEYFKAQNIKSVKINSVSGQGINKMLKSVENCYFEKKERLNQKGVVNRPINVMVVGIPNSGKSTLINKIAGKKSAETGNKPGVTKGKQWVRIGNRLNLLDTPGLLWPKFKDDRTGLMLAFTGSLKTNPDLNEEIAYALLDFIKKDYLSLLCNKYNLKHEEYDDTLKLYDEIAKNTGNLSRDKTPDYNKTAELLLNDFKNGRLGKITSEKPEEVI